VLSTPRSPRAACTGVNPTRGPGLTVMGSVRVNPRGLQPAPLLSSARHGAAGTCCLWFRRTPRLRPTLRVSRCRGLGASMQTEIERPAASPARGVAWREQQPRGRFGGGPACRCPHLSTVFFFPSGESSGFNRQVGEMTGSAGKLVVVVGIGFFAWVTKAK